MISLIVGKVKNGMFFSKEEIYAKASEQKDLFQKYLKLKLHSNETAFLFSESGGYLTRGSKVRKIPVPII